MGIVYVVISYPPTACRRLNNTCGSTLLASSGMAVMSPPKQITVLIAEDQAITRFGLKCSLEAFADLLVVADCADGVTTILQALATKPDIILMDIDLPKIDGIRASKEIKQALPNTHIVMFTASADEEHIVEALEAGASGYCLKTVASENLYAAIKAVTAGATWLDPGIARKLLKAQSRDSHEAANIVTPAEFPNKAALIERLGIKNYKNGRTPIGERYEIDGVLGRGGMGIVYKAKHVLMNRPVAIKMLHPEFAEDDNVVARFQAEAQTLSQLSHPNLVSVFDFGVTADKEPYMVMDFHSGQSLDSYMDAKGRLNTEIGLSIFKQVLSGLSVVHRAGIVHRDIKPGNMIISLEAKPQVKIVDFGIAKNPSTQKERLKITNTGEVVGTPRYMSPEQCTGKELDARSDIYALGCVMYECFSGKPAFDGDSFYELVRRHLNEPPSSLPFFQPGVSLPQGLVEIIFKALEKNPENRYQSAEEMLQAINKVTVSTAD
ncbi:hypothetical protein BH11CYA1_BH11CYA1_13600 [soil metagenome]